MTHPATVAPSWNWRRAYTFALTAALVAYVWHTSDRMVDIPTLRATIKGALGIILALVFTYVAGATATDWVQIIQAAKTSRKITESGEPPTPTTVTSLAGGGADDPEISSDSQPPAS